MGIGWSSSKVNPIDTKEYFLGGVHPIHPEINKITNIKFIIYNNKYKPHLPHHPMKNIITQNYVTPTHNMKYLKSKNTEEMAYGGPVTMDTIKIIKNFTKTIHKQYHLEKYRSEIKFYAL